MPIDTPAFQTLVEHYSKLSAKKLFQLCSHASQQNREAASLALISKTDPGSIHYQWLLVNQYDDLLGQTESAFKNKFIEAAYSAMEDPSLQCRA